MKMKKSILTLFTILCLLFTLPLIGYKTSVKASPDTIYVPTDYPTIQEAINHANSGDTIFVYNGIYYEHVVIDESISLVGEDRDSTIIDGGGTGIVISVTADNVNANGFTIQNSGPTDSDSGIYVVSSGNNISHNTITNNKNGIYLYYSSNNVISDNNAYSNYNDGIYLYYSNDNTVSHNNASSNNNGIHLYYSSSNAVYDNNASNNDCGIYLHYSNDNTVSHNNASSNNDYGIYLYYSSNNAISDNNASNNNDGIYLYYSSNNNMIYHNNFINNINQVWSDSVNVWNDDNEGNYWSNYTGQDLNGDGIGDTPYVIDANNQDNRPLMGMLSYFKVTWKEETHHVTTICNSTISDFRFEIARETGNKIISFNVSDGDGTVGFCRVIIPTELMNYSYIVLVDREEIISTLLDISNKTHAYLYFTYVHSGHTIAIISSKLLYLYNELLDKYVKLQIDFHDLNSTRYELLDNYSALLGNYSQLLEGYENYTSLLLEHTQNIRSLTYVFIATTAIFIIAAVYLSTHAHRKAPRD